MHNGLTAVDLLWAFGIPALQIYTATRGNSNLGFIRAFLYVQAFSEIAVDVSGLALGDNAYLYIWCAGAILNQALCAFVLTNIYDTVRLRALPSRTQTLPIFIMGAVAVTIGIHYAFLAKSLLSTHVSQMILPIDNSMSISIGIMLALLPFYMFAVGSSLRREMKLVVYGFALYELSYTGLMGTLITQQHLDLPHASDFVYLISLFLWSVALSSKSPIEVEERQLSNTLT